MTTESVPSTIELRAKLREHFGFRRFRPGQAEAVRAAVEGKDTLVIMPTGSGKSLCYQLPSLVLPGMTVIVSPLIALMKDQADNLREHDFKVLEMNSSLTEAQWRAAEEHVVAGKVEFLYTTPERMADPDFRSLLKKAKVGLFVVDEAHCASQWGHDFRPDYLTLGIAIEDLGSPPVLALTATATDDIVEDILTQLRIPNAEIVHTGFYRPNLHLQTSAVCGEEEKRGMLLELLGQVEGSGIIYAATVKAVEELANFLVENGIEAACYHGKLSTRRRTVAQDKFMDGELKVMVATNAFGLGIDKADIRFVIHYHLPGTMEAYYQECGRAGRDGQPAWCTLLYDPADVKLHKFFQGRRYPDDSDLVNAYHALGRLEDRPRGATFDEILAIAPLPKSRLKVCLALLANRGIVHTTGRRYRIRKQGLAREQLARAGQDYQERQERDRIRQKQMVEFAEGHTCRWRSVLDYFGGDEISESKCSHCDNCTPQLVAVAG